MPSLQKLLSPFWLLLLLWSSSSFMVESKCKKGCPALASYYVWTGANITFIAQVLGASTDDILSYNPSVPDKDRVRSGSRINVLFSCSCLNDGQLLGQFEYKVQKGDTYAKIAQEYYSNLTTANLIQNFNSFPTNNVPENSILKVPVNCCCGNSDVDKNYGFFLTYPLRPEDSLSSIAQFSNSTPSLLQRYNPNAKFSAGTGIVFIPAKDKTGQYPPLPSSSGLSGAVIAVISVAVVAVVIMLAVLFLHMRRKKKKKASLFLDNSGEWLGQSVQGSSRKTASSLDAGNRGVTVDKSVEFSYEELALATDNFSMANKIGSGGFGDVYYAELRGEKAAVKKMDMQASKEFLAELQVLTRVHHLNLVRLIGYCVEECLFLVYEFIENGNLSQHLRGTGKEPLPWSTRVQIALDSARGLEYIHEHTVPVYIHRDIKSANILIDKSCHAKVADFGLTKLTEVGNYSAPTRLVGTFGYMPPEYAQYGEVSPKVDVYAFGVVLYELISAKAAVVKQNASGPDSKGLVGMFEAVLKQQNDQNEIRKLVDPRLGDDYPLDSVFKVAQLAYKCTQEDPHLRPSMRSVVVNLMTLSSTTGEWDTGTFYESRQGSLVSAR
ncbi:chitin elicitor receptor kinase 1-like isoform X2 [Chenopodium quinoa]|uniref:chitin elicitor receptor kinase 1-like isoform X2 n=1 Tax=Chenopodium quinoa TaxID=63459 RepID=UPI000B77E250|nr:chitin elicitor receptor kinase 1-like isoform X2 [Chenopodium quinoa]